jgi:hypothetical protein
MDKDLLDRLAVKQLVDDWIMFRDSGDWERFRAVWHDDGIMQATWTQGTADEFLAMSKAAWAKGIRVLHSQGPSTIEIAGDRAISVVKMAISQRAVVHDVLVDVVCSGRFYDLIERRAGKWGFVYRQPIYEKDRMDPVDPSATVKLDPAVLAQYPVGYRHLAYLQSSIGYKIKADMPGIDGLEVERLYAMGRRWLKTGKIAFDPRS